MAWYQKNTVSGIFCKFSLIFITNAFFEYMLSRDLITAKESDTMIPFLILLSMKYDEQRYIAYNSALKMKWILDS